MYFMPNLVSMKFITWYVVIFLDHVISTIHLATIARYRISRNFGGTNIWRSV